MTDINKLGRAGLVSVAQTLVNKQGKLSPAELARLASAAGKFSQLAGGAGGVKRAVTTEEDNGLRLEGPSIELAPQAKAIGDGLIREFPEDLGHLEQAAIAYFFDADALRLHGADASAIAWVPQVQGEAWKRAIFEQGLAKLTGFPPSLVVIVQLQEWTIRDHAERRRLIFHEILHFQQAEGPNGEPKFTTRGEVVWRVVPHDVEQFNRVVELFGPDQRDMEHLRAANRWSTGK